MVVFPAATGMMGVLPQHVPTVSQMKPGVVTVIEEGKVGGRQVFRFSVIIISL